jgi:serine/threonine-protein kinase
MGTTTPKDDGSQVETLVGRTLDYRYRIVNKLGAGGVGDVYRAEHLRLKRPVAVKVLQPAFVASEGQRVRFEREAQALSALTHPNVVGIADYGMDECPFLVMELLQGKTLARAIKEGPMELPLALEVTRQILRALAFAHQAGLIHRDLKPGNVYLQPLVDGAYHVKILDFGLAKFVTGDRDPGGPQVTVTGMVFGTPAYMSPEQATGTEVDHRADLYSTGVVLYEMLAGRRPFLGEIEELLRQQLLAPVPPLAEVCPSRGFPPEYDQFFDKVLAKERSQRFADAREMLAALNELPLELSSVNAVAEEEALAATVYAGTPGDNTAETAMGKRQGLPSPSQGKAPSQLPWRFLAIAGTAGFLAALAMTGLVAIGWSALSGGESVQAAAVNRPSAGPAGLAALPGVAEPAQRQPDAASVALPPSGAVDPWAGPVPQVLRRAKTVVDRGRKLSPGQLRNVRGYAMRHRDDPRPLLLLARNSIHRGHLTDGIVRYERAFAADAGARFDPQMLPDLVKLVHSRTVGRRAAGAVGKIYGIEALGPIRQALAVPDLEQRARRRLLDLEQTLASANR